MFTPGNYDFYTRLAQTINSGQSRAVLLHGNTLDLFAVVEDEKARYVPLIQYLAKKCEVLSTISQVTIELNGPLVFHKKGEESTATADRLRDAWRNWKQFLNPGLTVSDLNKEFSTNVNESAAQPAYALEFLRQLCMAMRWNRQRTNQFLERIIIFVESAEMVVPAGTGDIAQLQTIDRRKVGILEDWFSDPEFYEGSDSLVMISQSKSLIHPRIVEMPQVYSIEVPSPNVDEREHFIQYQWNKTNGPPWNIPAVAKQSAGLSLQALRQLLIEANYKYPNDTIPADLIIEQVERYIKGQIGEDVVEFKKPTHTFEDVIGFRGLKKFLIEKLIPRIKRGGKGSLAAMGVAGPIGVGKSFIFEAMANELDMPVIVLKNIRSKWFGQTDVIFEKLRGLLEAIGSSLVFVDEADTQFGGLGEETHETERRLTGKVQAMMSDPRLKGNTLWLLMTARIEKLSPDMRRRGRAGDLIIPVLDPKFNENDLHGANDYNDFVDWLLRILPGDKTSEEFEKVARAMMGRSAGDFASIRSEAVAEEAQTVEQLLYLIDDMLDTDIAKTRRYQELQALMNYTRKSLVPDVPDPRTEREKWQTELNDLKLKGYGR